MKRDWKFWYENALCGSDKRYKEVRRGLFSDMTDTLQLMEAAHQVAQNNPSIRVNKGIKDRAAAILDVARARFPTLNLEQVDRLLKVFSFSFQKDGARYGFNLTQVLCKTDAGDIRAASRVISFFIDRFKERNHILNEESTDENKARGLLMFHFQEFLLLGPPSSPTWDTLVTSARNGDVEAEKLLRLSLLVPYIYYGITTFDVRPFPDSKGAGDALIETLSGKFAKGSVWIVGASKENEVYLGKLLLKFAAENREMTAHLASLVAWFKEHRLELVEEAKQKWDEIKTRATKLLRNGGRDRIRLGLKGLKSVGFSDLQFFPDNMEFPETRARFWLRNLLGGDSAFSYNICDFIFSEENDAIFLEDEKRWVINMLMAFIAIDCYHRIVVSPERSSIKTGTSRKKATRPRTEDPGQVVVRPHIRRLQPGFQPSLGAIARYDEARHAELPSGFTFVKEHNRGYAEEVEFTEPLFTYTEEDLGYANGAEQ